MRIGAISDLHVDDSPEGVVADAVAAAAEGARVDALVVAGDVSSSWDITLAAIDELRGRCGVPVLFVPGNHDVWTKHHGGDSPEAIYARLAAHPACLSGRVAALGPYSIVGDLGWYDGSLAEGRFSGEELFRMEYGGRVWQDSLYARWELPAAGKALEFAEKLEGLLAGLDPRRTIVATHVLPRLEFTVQPPEGVWTYFNGLLGSARYGELFSRKQVRASICGHVHYRRRFEADGVDWICACLGTPKEWRSGDARTEAAAALAVLEL